MHTDRATVDAILDEALHCHVAFVREGEPQVLPTVHVRVADALYLHGSTGSAMMRMAAGTDTGPGTDAGGAGLPVCVAATIVDGIVFGRSHFHHSVNYRSVIAHGTASVVTDPAVRGSVLAALIEKVAVGRAADSRPPTAKELASTALLAVPLADVAAKVRTGEASDEGADLALPYWAGVLPMRLVAGAPESFDPTIPVPEYVREWRGGGRITR